MIQHSDLSIPVYEKLKEMIIDNELKPGEKLLQEKLASQLGVSRNRLLKALQMLEHELLLESIPRRGMFIKKLSNEEMCNIYDAREGIETVAVRLTSEMIRDKQLRQLKKIWKPFKKQSRIDFQKHRKADDRFHALLLEFSGNKILLKIFSHSLVQLRVEQMGLMQPPEETFSEHLAILKAIETKDAEQAVIQLRDHLQKSKALIMENFKN